MKDESEGKIIGDIVRSKSKMHSMKNVDGKEYDTAKGVNIATDFNEFKDTLFNKKVLRHKMRIIQSKKHKMGTYKVNKISLSVFDDKIFFLDDGIHTLAYFHKDFKKQIHTDDHKLEEFQKDSHKWLQMLVNRDWIGGLIGVRVTSIDYQK